MWQSLEVVILFIFLWCGNPFERRNIVFTSTKASRLNHVRWDGTVRTA